MPVEKAASWERFSVPLGLEAGLGVDVRAGAVTAGRVFRAAVSASSDLYLFREAEREDMAAVLRSWFVRGFEVATEVDLEDFNKEFQVKEPRRES